MKSTCFPVFFLLSITLSFGQKLAKFNDADEGALRELTIKWQRYWNTHNMDSMGTMLTENVDFVNVAGVWLKNKAETVADHKQKHSEIIFKNSTWVTDSIEIKYVKPDLAIIHLNWGISGDNDPDGTPRKPRHGIFTWLVIKDNSWKILAAQNTNKRDNTTQPIK